VRCAILALVALVACDMPSQEELRQEIDYAVSECRVTVTQQIVLAAATIVEGCSIAALGLADATDDVGSATERIEDATVQLEEATERVATQLLLRLGCTVDLDGYWECSHGALCGEP
jgi:hypothetical protein